MDEKNEYEVNDIDELFERMDEERRNTPWHKRFYYRIKHVFSSFLEHIIHAWQRLTRGYDDTAWWNADNYLATLIPMLMQELRAKGHGVPAAMYDGLTPNKDGSYDEESQKVAEKKWSDILTAIEEGFDEYVDVQNCALNPDHELVKFNKAFDLFRQYFSALWD